MKYKILILNIFIIFIKSNVFCQFCDQPNYYGENNDYYDESLYGYNITSRNYPYPYHKIDSISVPCRKLIKKPSLYNEFYYENDISKIILKPYSQLTTNEKLEIIYNKNSSYDSVLLNIAIQVALNDKSKEERINRMEAIKCLSFSKSLKAKEVLIKLLKEDQVISEMSAFALIQSGFIDDGLKYIKENSNKICISESLIDALMIANTEESIEMLKQCTNAKDPSEALDAVAALSLLGHCDYAFNSFCKYIDDPRWQVRDKVVWCLAYYIGTYAAYKKLYEIALNDKEAEVQNSAKKAIMIYFKIKK